MSDDIVKTLLESLTEEQKAQLVQGLISNMNQTVSRPPSKETPIEQEETVSSPTRQEVAEDFTVNRQNHKNRKIPVKAKKNQWVDDGTFGNDIDFDYQKFEKMKKLWKIEDPRHPVCFYL